HIGLAQHYRASRHQTFHNRGIESWSELIQHARSTGGANAPGTKNVLAGKGNARQGATFPRAQLTVGRVCLRQRTFPADGDVTVECFVARLDALEKVFRQLPAAE